VNLLLYPVLVLFRPKKKGSGNSSCGACSGQFRAVASPCSCATAVMAKPSKSALLHVSIHGVCTHVIRYKKKCGWSGMPSTLEVTTVLLQRLAWYLRFRIFLNLSAGSLMFRNLTQMVLKAWLCMQFLPLISVGAEWCNIQCPKTPMRREKKTISESVPEIELV